MRRDKKIIIIEIKQNQRNNKKTETANKCRNETRRKTKNKYCFFLNNLQRSNTFGKTIAGGSEKQNKKRNDGERSKRGGMLEANFIYKKKVLLKTCVINHFYDSKRTNNYFVLSREKAKECGW